MLKLGLIGCGISRTQVHQLYSVLGQLSGVPLRYDLIDVSGEPQFNLKARLNQCERERFSGVNITHPFKIKAHACVSDTDTLPTGLGALNTIVFRSSRWQGYNTDYSGFTSAYRARFGHRAPGAVLLLGAGGVGRAIAFALVRLGATSITVYDIDLARAQLLVAQLCQVGTPAHLVSPLAPFEWIAAPGQPAQTLGLAHLVAEAQRAQGVINSTPLGMHQQPGNPLPEAGFQGPHWAFDAVYTPSQTAFLTTARQHGLETMDGFDLFLHQGFDAFEHFSGRIIDRPRAVATYLQHYPQAPQQRPLLSQTKAT